MLQRVFDSIISPSTRAFWRESRSSGQSVAEFLHGYIYMRWPYFYIAMGKGTHPLAKKMGEPLARIANMLGLWRPDSPAQGSGGFADTYHGKTIPPAAARKLITVRREITVPDLEKVIPYSMARAIILQHPDHIALLDCPCRLSEPDHCTPVDVCLIVGEPFAGFILEHHPEKSRRITQQEALDVVRRENRRGHVSHAFFKEALLGRYYAICNCCSCCCGAMKAHFAGLPMLASSGYLAQVDAGACTGCGACEAKCQFSAIRVLETTARVDTAECMGCGICELLCPSRAVSLRRAPEKGLPLEPDNLTGTAAAVAADTCSAGRAD
ncbi:4Fe-4S binding protein [Oleidesulfovibrio alaskensis]|jgi:ferredoxin|uniref:4Fe-4S binding protein n=1 Tax=Oleidesulfovibrio alaskensis TaxID=58180 RepID=UPI001A4BD89A|nr:4Fe-4S binding protein [Oleidesulfovibrio alaskensis]MBL3581334.1 4Fe-4S binding protein [Oleidesulfovibrio alaskensis]